MVAPAHTCNLNHRKRVPRQRPIAPGQVGRARAFADGHQGTDSGIIAPCARNTDRLSVVDFGNDLLLRYTRFQHLDCAVHSPGTYPPRFAHKFDFGTRLHQPSPVDEVAVVRKPRLRQSFQKMRMTSCCVVMRIHLYPDAGCSPSAIADEGRKFVIGMMNRMLNERFGECHNIAIGKIRRDVRAFGILGAAEPYGHLLVEMDENALRNVERPAVETGEPVHIRRILADDEVETSLLHPLLGIGDPTGKFRGREWLLENGQFRLL